MIDLFDQHRHERKSPPDPRYWGKADLQFGPDAHHLLQFHSLDVAAVMHTLLRRRADLLSYFAEALGLEREQTQQLLTWIALVHDLGKFAENFQVKRQDLFDAAGLVGGEYVESSHRHDVVGFCLWDDALEYTDWRNSFSRSMLCLLHASTAHHGLPSTKVAFCEAISKSSQKVAFDFARWGLEHFELNAHPGLLNKARHLASASWLFAGTVIYADWLGSGTEWFKYVRDPELSLETYWQEFALPRAEQAIQASRSVPVAISAVEPYAVVQLDSTTARPAQQLAVSLQLGTGPQLFILEDATGSGKTEAAMLLALRLSQQGAGNGLYVALPTMATANGLLPRIKKIAEGFVTHPELAALALAHSAARWMDGFDSRKGNKESEDQAQSAGLRASAWINDHRKRALIAQIGVGTIDQALLAVLKAKHNSIRLFGLFGKVLVIDEVHAYDAYQLELIQALLCAHRAQGGSTILLSATLPLEKRTALLESYAPAAPTSDQHHGAQAAYPLLSHAQTQAITYHPVVRIPALLKRYRIRYLKTQAEVIALLLETARSGRCVAWIRNTVREAVKAFEAVQAAMQADDKLGLTLFHARFAFCDRAEKESQVLQRFGPAGPASGRCGQIVIATQVIEQSLDLDFDELISDLAPIDLLIQRAGRLRRHRRALDGSLIADAGADQRGPATLTVFGPDRDLPEAEVKASWYPEFSPGSAMIYLHHGQIWRSAQALGQVLDLTSDPRAPIEAVYASEEWPGTLQNSSFNALGIGYANEGEAQRAKVELKKPFARQGNWSDDERAATRLGDPTTEITLACLRDGVISPWAEKGSSDAERWALSVVKVRAAWLEKRAGLQGGLEDQARALEETPSLKWRVLLVLEQKGSLQTATAKQGPTLVTFTYSTERGLEKRASKTL